MSCFIVSDETINKVLHLLDMNACFSPRGYLGVPYVDTERGGDGVVSQISKGGMIGRNLRELNREAYCERYAQHRPYVRNSEPFDWTPRQYKLIPMVKAAQCWLYQCAEGDAFMKSPIYEEVKMTVERALAKIVSELPEWDAAPWE